MDSSGQDRLSMRSHPDFGPLLSFHGSNKKERMRLGSDQNADDKPFLWMFDCEFERVKTIEP